MDQSKRQLTVSFQMHLYILTNISKSAPPILQGSEG